MWSLVLAIVDVYAILVGRRLQNPGVVRLFAVGDGVSSSPRLRAHIYSLSCCWQTSKITSIFPF